MINIEARCIRHHGGIGTGNLYGDRGILTRVVDTALRLFTAPEQCVGRDHFRDCQAGTLRTAKLPEGPVGDTRHGCQDQVVR